MKGRSNGSYRANCTSLSHFFATHLLVSLLPAALECYQRCLRLREEEHDSDGVADAWLSMGHAALQMGDYEGKERKDV